MQFHVIRLQFISPLHISKGSEDYSDSHDFLHSDTLKSALFVCYVQLFNDFSSNFFDLFSISSAFPYYQEIRFFPKPFLKLPLKIKQERSSNIKKLKKLQWLDKTLFEKCINNENTDISLNNFTTNAKFLSLQFDVQNNPKIYFREEQSRVKINYGQDSDPFYFERIYFEKDAGLYVLVECTTDFLHQKLMPAFYLLGQNGVGSYKTIGNGQFEPVLEKQEMTLRIPQKSEYLLNLSLYCPTRHDIEQINMMASYYELIKRGGYLANPQDVTKMDYRKKSLYMFQEGSVFHAQSLKGKLADLAPKNIEHPVYREGRPIFIPVKKTE